MFLLDVFPAAPMKPLGVILITVSGGVNGDVNTVDMWNVVRLTVTN